MESLHAWLRDVLYELRAVRRRPGLALTVLITLALSIGANTAIFSVVEAVLLKPLAYPQPERLVTISGGVTPVHFAEIQAGTRSYSAIGAYTNEEDVTVTGGGQPEVLKAARVSADGLRILGVSPLLGRGFRAEEDTPGGPAVALISAGLWERRFSGSTRVLGSSINLGAVPYTVVGVLPPEFQFPASGLDVLLTRPTEWPVMSPQTRQLSPFLAVFGRLKPGVTLAQATAEMTVVQQRYRLNHPAMLDARRNTPVEVKPLKEGIVADARTSLWMLTGAVAFVLLIACANLANLLLAQASARSREFAVRAALGATRGRLTAQLLAESLLLSLGGGAAGLLLAEWILHGIRSSSAFDLPRAGEIHLDGTVLAFAIALSLVTGVLFGLAPALTASATDLIGALRARSEASSVTAPRRMPLGFSLRGLLVILQIALSMVLLVGAALLIESVVHLRGEDLGFNPTHLLTLKISLPPTRYNTDVKIDRFFDDLRARTAVLPGVRAVAASMTLPMRSFPGSPVQDAKKPLLPLNQRRLTTILIVSPGYFHTLGIPLRRGRDFNERDRTSGQRVAIIDEAMARRLSPDYPHGVDPIGQHLLIGGVNPKPAEVIGVAAGAHQSLDTTLWPETVYVSFEQNPPPFGMLAVRTDGDPLRVTSEVRKQVQALDRDQAVSEIKTMTDLVEAQLGQRRLLMGLLIAFASVALFLALVGIYGVIAYSVAQRTREMGIRRALGAPAGSILRLVVGQAFGLALAGAALGCAGAVALTHALDSLLFHVSATDPATFAVIAALSILAALAASYLPARRATRVDPMSAVKYE